MSEDETRGEGRNRSEIPELNARLRALEGDLREEGTSPASSPLSLSVQAERAFLFTLEAYASALFQRLRAELFEARLGMPKSDTEVFSILQKSGKLDLIEARKLRQFCEARWLSSRDLKKIDIAGAREGLVELELIRSILNRLA